MTQKEKTREEFIEEIKLLKKRITELETLNNERSQVERELQKQKQLYENIFNISQTIVLVLDSKGCIVTFNPYMEQISGYRLEEVKGKDWFEIFIPKQIQNKIRELFFIAIGDIQTKGDVNAIIAKDGHEIQIEWYDKTIKDGDGSIKGLVSIGVDVGERKKANDKLSYFKKVVDTATDAIGMSTPEGRHYYQNEAFTQLFGLSASQVDGVSGPPETVYADEKEGRKIFDIIMKGNLFIGEIKMIDKDRNEKDIFLRSYPIKDEEGKVVGLVGIHTDITERKKAEKLENKRLNELEVFYEVAVGREGRVLELKKEVEQLKKELNEKK